MDHGGDLGAMRARHGGEAADWLDLSTGINPHAWPVPEPLDEAFWRKLPQESDRLRLIEAARRAYQVPDEVAIVAAPGTQALIQWLPWLAPTGPMALLGPTYSEHAIAWRRAGRTIGEIRRIEDMPAGAIHLVLVNPNNPDGHVVDIAHLAGLAATCAKRGGWLIVDESFVDVMPHASAAPLAVQGPVVILRSFGKFYGLAGVRLGFALAPPAIAASLDSALGPWAVSGPALALGRAALSDPSWAHTMRIQLTGEALRLDAMLEERGLTIIGGTSLFRLVRHPLAGKIHEALAAERILVRRFTHDATLLRFGLCPDAIAFERLSQALGRALAASHG